MGSPGVSRRFAIAVLRARSSGFVVLLVGRERAAAREVRCADVHA